MIDYRTTHWIAGHHPNTFKSTTTGFIKLCQTQTLNSIKVFPNDLVIAIFTKNEKTVHRRFDPAPLSLYRYIWELSNDLDRVSIRKHLKRCVYVRESFKKKLCSVKDQIWYMAVILGSINDENNK